MNRNILTVDFRKSSKAKLQIQVNGKTVANTIRLLPRKWMDKHFRSFSNFKTLDALIYKSGYGAKHKPIKLSVATLKFLLN